MTRPAASAAGAGQFFGDKWGNGERLLLAACVGLSFSRYFGQRTMTKKGAKRNVPHLLQAQQAPVCLWSMDLSALERFSISDIRTVIPAKFFEVWLHLLRSSAEFFS